MKKVISFFMIFTVMMIFSDITSYGKSSVLGPGFYIEDSGDGQQPTIESDDLNIVATGLVKPLYVPSTSKEFIQLSNCNEALFLEVYMDVTDVINNIITFEETNVYYGKLAGTCNPNLENSFYEVKYTLSIEDIDFTNQSIVFTMIDISYFIFNNSDSFNDKLVQNPVDISESFYVFEFIRYATIIDENYNLGNLPVYRSTNKENIIIYIPQFQPLQYGFLGGYYLIETQLPNGYPIDYVVVDFDNSNFIEITFYNQYSDEFLNQLILGDLY